MSNNYSSKVEKSIKKTFVLFSLVLLVFSCTTTKPIPKATKRLSLNEVKGVIHNRSLLDSLLEVTTVKKIDPQMPIVIIYYPGKDECNSSGKATRISSSHWFDEMENGINRIQKSTILYFYKDRTDLYDVHDGFRIWYKDPDSVIEQLFFNEKNTCGIFFVVVSEKGKYISHFGEFGKEYVWKVTELLTSE